MQGDQTAREEAELAEAIALSIASAGGGAPPEQPQDEEERQMQEALALSMQQPSGGGSGGGTDDGAMAGEAMPTYDPAAAADAENGGPSLGCLIFGDTPNPEVLRQWKAQPIAFADVDISDTPGITPFSAGLAQEHGGPCAILAATQGFLLRRLFFDPSPSAPQPSPAWLDASADGDGSLLPSEAEASEALLCGLTDMLCGCAIAPSANTATPPSAGSFADCAVVLCVPTDEQLAGGSLLTASRDELLKALVATAARPRGWSACLDALRSRAAGLNSPLGALSVLISAVLTRGVQRFCDERDDATMPLLDMQFGHCSQEGLNLLLAGVGVSNVFDGSRDLGGGFVLRGVPARSPVGLLSQLEALRYLQVGTFFKQPMHPIWVVASESHYSLLFATSNEVQATDAVSELEERLLAAFSEFDQEGNGFISAEHLQTLITSLPQWQCPPLDELRNQLDPDGLSLIMWDAFQRVMMPLHPVAREHVQKQAAQEAAQQVEQGFSAPARDQPGLAKAMSLYHYNGLGGGGHSHKRALRLVEVTPGGAAGQPAAGEGLASCIATRWKDAKVTHEGPPPSIN